jgi:hypothetical protein
MTKDDAGHKETFNDRALGYKPGKSARITP